MERSSLEQRTAPADRASRLAAFVPDIWDVLVLAGLLVFLAGVWLIYIPAALIAGGVILVGFGCYGAAKWES